MSPWDVSPEVGQLGPLVLRPGLPKGLARAPGCRSMPPSPRSADGPPPLHPQQQISVAILIGLTGYLPFCL